ncbi:MAG: AMP-binding protein [Deltaproteobacteria bacterium]|nr:AMP-binding protein [Deltaproteobacteria bacterium]MBW2259451.1 AMP-binding protein [Deltaproteobacteria bacterium]
MRFWDDENEQMKEEDVEQLQLERLQSTLNRAYKNVPFYKKQFDAADIDPGALGSVGDIHKLPFTTREDLGSNYPYGLFALPLRDIVRISSSTGTTPQPVVVGYTKSDLKIRSALTARFLTAGGAVDTDVVQICLNPGLLNWGRALKEGAEEIGASVMPMSHMSTSKQLMAMEDYKTSVLLTTPSYAMHMIEVMKTTGTKADALALKAMMVVGEALPREVRNGLESTLEVDVTAAYGLSDVTGPGIAYECMEKDGLHISEDHFLVEIVNVDENTPCAPGEEGEVVLTTLTAKAFPLIRFKTGDLASKMTRACPCGRTLMRMSGITGYSGEVLTIRGVKVHPAQIGRIIDRIAQNFSPRFLIHLYRENYQDMIEIWLEVNDAVFSDEVKVLEGMLRHLGEQILEILGLHTTIRLVEAETIEQHLARSGGVVDDR